MARPGETKGNPGRQDLLKAGLSYLEGGINLIPVNAKKTPADPPLPYQRWKRYQTERVTKVVLRNWVNTPGVYGWAMVCGKISGNLTIMDFDEPAFYERWKAEVGDLAQILPTQQTGSGVGYQVGFRSNLSIRNDKLAYVPADNAEGRLTAIETRGQGGYAVVAPSYCPEAIKCGKKHRQPYKVIQGDFAKIPTLSDEQAQFLLETAQSLDEMPLSKKQMQSAPLPPNRNGDGADSGVIGTFNERFEVSAILERNRYEKRGSRFLAPDSTTGLPGVHIFDNGRCYSHHANDPLNDDHAHDAFDVFRLLEHGGDLRAAVKAAAGILGMKMARSGVEDNTNWQPPPSPKWPLPPGQEAYHGLAGEFVKMVAPHTEADEMALLIQFLTSYGNVIGPHAYYQVERDKHHGKIFCALVGDTAKARKGTSWGHVKNQFEAVDQKWTQKRIKGGLASGEGLIWEVRDPIYKREPEKSNGKNSGNYIEVLADSGVEDKRLLVYEAEFASILKVMSREGNTLSDIIRKAWDTTELNTLAKNSPAHASGAHISMIGHITADELRRHLDRTEMANGFGNRYLWICVKRSKILPHGGKIDQVDFGPFLQRLQAAVDFAGNAQLITMTPAARETWVKVYEPLSEGKPGLIGALLARGEAQVIRLAVIFALMDRTKHIDTAHLKAGLAVWDYCEASVRFIFGDAVGDPVADTILTALKNAPQGLNQTEINYLFGRNINAARIAQAMNLLLKYWPIIIESQNTGGRPATVYKLRITK